MMRDKHVRTTFAYVVECKGPGDNWAIKMMDEDIRELGHTDIELKGNGELALVQVQDELQRRRTPRTIPINPPAYDPQGNGVIERASQEVMNQLRCVKIGLAAELQAKVADTNPILE